MSERLRKLNDLLRDEVGKTLHEELENDEGVLLTVISATVSPTLEHATIKVSIFPTEQSKKVLEKIEKNIYRIQQTLNKRLTMRPVPKIRFEIDTTEERAHRIEEVLGKIKK